MNTALAPWQQRIYDTACEAMDEGRLPHALLFAGPALLGKRQVAEHLARRLLCLERRAGEAACGHCRSCQLFDNRIQPEPLPLRPDGSPAHPFGLPTHPDARFISYEMNERTQKMRGEIVIEQIRQMSEKLALTPQYGEHQVALLDPADAINHAACNALLKTLEEPQPGRFIWLLSATPARLPATIRSRTQRLDFRLPPSAEALAWLQQQGHSPARSTQALAMAHGHPGLANHWLKVGALDLRAEVGKDLDALRRSAATATATATAQRWMGDANAGLRLAFAADIAVDAARSETPDSGRIGPLAHWFDQCNRCRDLLRAPVRTELATLELLLAWHALWR